MKKVNLILFAALTTLYINAQNLFPIKLANCKTDRFCLDCGSVKAGYDESEFVKLQDKLNKELNLQGIKGAVKFQVLVDDKGEACVLSHTELFVSESKYLKVWSSNEPVFRQIMQVCKLEETPNLNFIDEFPKVVERLKMHNPEVAETENIIQELVSRFK